MGDSEPSAATPRRKKSLARRILPIGVTLLIFYFIFRRIPFARLAAALEAADYGLFLALMVPNAIVYFAWDTFVLGVAVGWFHRQVRYRDLLPVRAVSYILALLNSELAGGATACYLVKQTGASFLAVASTLLFLNWLELTHLTLWATAGMLGFPAHLMAGMIWIPFGVAAFWFLFLFSVRSKLSPWQALLFFAARVWPRLGRRVEIRNWAIFRTFVAASWKQYAGIVLLRAPLFFFTLVIHYFAAPAFGIHIPFLRLLAFLPIVFAIAAMPVTVAHLGTTQAAWIFFFRDYASAPQLLAFSLAAHLAFMLTRGALGLAFMPRAYQDLVDVLSQKQLLLALPRES